jgi:2-polyprenyl-3-methyl-5-hydroxy-6-metoxy-1,4-benzoquinol methylase
MTLKLDIDLSEDQKARMAELPATAWFTQVVFRNAASPVHPVAALVENNELKLSMVRDWIAEAVPGKRVLDLFAGNGVFSVVAAQAGAREVVGVEFAEDRVRCAEFVASTLRSDCRFVFKHGDVYRLTEYFRERFDVVLCLGGLYHVADPALILRQIGQLTKERLILQTSQVLSVPGNWAKFRLRQDRTREGLTSLRGGSGTWWYSPECVRSLLAHGGFRIIEERRPRWRARRRFPWYLAKCGPAV